MKINAKYIQHDEHGYQEETNINDISKIALIIARSLELLNEEKL